MVKKSKVNGNAVAPTHVRKNWMKLLCASLALVLIGFVSCKKDKDMMVSKSVVTEINEGFDPNVGYFASDAWVSQVGVAIKTEFVGTPEWTNKQIQVWDDNVGNFVHVYGTIARKFSVRTSLGGSYQEYESFCAHYGSGGLGEQSEYEVGALDAGKKAKIIRAFNYIHDTYGDIFGWAEGAGTEAGDRTPEMATRVLAQIAVWMVMHEETISNMVPVWAEPGREYRNYIGFQSVINNVIAATTNSQYDDGIITNVYYLVVNGVDPLHKQPQIVPVGKKTPPVHPCEELLPYTDFDKGVAYESSSNTVLSGGCRFAVTYTANPDWLNGFNDWFQDFAVRNTETGKVYPSYCAHYFSNNLGGANGILYYDKTAEFKAFKPQAYKDILSALNFIYDTWGSLDAYTCGAPTNAQQATKIIANVVVWMLAGDGVSGVNVAWIDYSTKQASTLVNECIDLVMRSFDGYTGTETVTEFVFLAQSSYASGNEWNAITNCQPQIVPIYDCPDNPPVATGLNWNNGVAKPEKDGENGVGLNQFTLDGFTLKNNKNYLARTNFLNKFDGKVAAAPGKNDEKAFFTLIERTPLYPNQFNGNGKYKSYEVYVALYKTTAWKFYEGVITVDNPGGNNNKQKLVFKGTNNFDRIKK